MTGNPPILLPDGRAVSTAEFAALVYQDLRRIAMGLIRSERIGITLQPTALVHEAYINLADRKDGSWECRAQFMRVAATAMRHVLVDAARARGSQKRGGGWARVTLSSDSGQTDLSVDILDLRDALEKLGKVSERYVTIVELRYFAGLTQDEVAQALGVSRTIIVREWGLARAWLAAYLEETPQQ